MTNRQKKVACMGLILFIIWNSTDEIQLFEELSIFKHKLKTYFFA